MRHLKSTWFLSLNTWSTQKKWLRKVNEGNFGKSTSRKSEASEACNDHYTPGPNRQGEPQGNCHFIDLARPAFQGDIRKGTFPLLSLPIPTHYVVNKFYKFLIFHFCGFIFKNCQIHASFLMPLFLHKL